MIKMVKEVKREKISSEEKVAVVVPQEAIEAPVPIQFEFPG